MAQTARTDDAALLEEIGSLIAARDAPDRELLARIEHTLTAGYVRALELEAETLRLERRIREVASELAAGSVQRDAELISLARGAAAADGHLGHLRGLLRALRERASEVRTA